MQEAPQQKRKLINECNDSLGTLLLQLVGVLLHKYHALLLTVFDASFSLDEHSTSMAEIVIGLSPDLPGT